MKRHGDILVACTYCGKPTYKWSYQLKQECNHFCDRRCKGQWFSLHRIAEKSCNWKGGSYSTIANILCNSRYRRVRALVVALDKNCVLCNSVKNLQVHHIIEKGKNAALIYDVTNMITLCRKCHFGIRGREDSYIGYFSDIVAKRVNSGDSRTDNPEPSVQSTKVQRLLEHGDVLNNQNSALHESDEIVQLR